MAGIPLNDKQIPSPSRRDFIKTAAIAVGPIVKFVLCRKNPITGRRSLHWESCTKECKILVLLIEDFDPFLIGSLFIVNLPV